MIIDVYCDGACSPNPGKGGWSYVVVENDIIIEQYGGYLPNTTNQVMELTALLNACKACERLGAMEDWPKHSFIIHSDSAYCVNCVKQNWWVSWQNNGWRNMKKQPVANKELWEQLIPYFTCPNITIEKCKGHSGDHYNEIVDQLAVSYRSEI